MKNIRKICIFLFFLSFFMYLSCPYWEDYSAMVFIYKTKNDYSDNMFVPLSADKTRIKSCPDPQDPQDIYFYEKYPIKLANNHLLFCNYPIENIGFLSITKTEYMENYDVAPEPDSLYSLLIDKEPFIEYYYVDGHFFNNGLDTAWINNIIINGELELYFERLK
ncbi:MAG: hypothetical protein ACP5DZ_11400 [Bacteroidales bacterium]